MDQSIHLQKTPIILIAESVQYDLPEKEKLLKHKNNKILSNTKNHKIPNQNTNQPNISKLQPWTSSYHTNNPYSPDTLRFIGSSQQNSPQDSQNTPPITLSKTTDVGYTKFLCSVNHSKYAHPFKRLKCQSVSNSEQFNCMRQGIILMNDQNEIITNFSSNTKYNNKKFIGMCYNHNIKKQIELHNHHVSVPSNINSKKRIPTLLSHHQYYLQEHIKNSDKQNQAIFMTNKQDKQNQAIFMTNKQFKTKYKNIKNINIEFSKQQVKQSSKRTGLRQEDLENNFTTNLLLTQPFDQQSDNFLNSKKLTEKVRKKLINNITLDNQIIDKTINNLMYKVEKNTFSTQPLHFYKKQSLRQKAIDKKFKIRTDRMLNQKNIKQSKKYPQNMFLGVDQRHRNNHRPANPINIQPGVYIDYPRNKNSKIYSSFQPYKTTQERWKRLTQSSLFHSKFLTPKKLKISKEKRHLHTID